MQREEASITTDHAGTMEQAVSEAEAVTEADERYRRPGISMPAESIDHIE